MAAASTTTAATRTASRRSRLVSVARLTMVFACACWNTRRIRRSPKGVRVGWPAGAPHALLFSCCTIDDMSPVLSPRIISFPRHDLPREFDVSCCPISIEISDGPNPPLNTITQYEHHILLHAAFLATRMSPYSSTTTHTSRILLFSLDLAAITRSHRYIIGIIRLCLWMSVPTSSLLFAHRPPGCYSGLDEYGPR